MISDNKIKIAIVFFITCIAASYYTVAAEIQNQYGQEGLRISVFDIDATPPVGSYLAYDKMINEWDLGLRARGIVLMGAGRPIVLCSVDWIGISNDREDAFRTELAKAAGTLPERVAVHTVHQHDAPICLNKYSLIKLCLF